MVLQLRASHTRRPHPLSKRAVGATFYSCRVWSWAVLCGARAEFQAGATCFLENHACVRTCKCQESWPLSLKRKNRIQPGCENPDQRMKPEVEPERDEVVGVRGRQQSAPALQLIHLPLRDHAGPTDCQGAGVAFQTQGQVRRCVQPLNSRHGRWLCSMIEGKCMKGKFNWGGGGICLQYVLIIEKRVRKTSGVGLIIQPSTDWMTAGEGSKQQPVDMWFLNRHYCR